MCLHTAWSLCAPNASVLVPCSLGLTEEQVSEIQVLLLLIFLPDAYAKIKKEVVSFSFIQETSTQFTLLWSYSLILSTSQNKAGSSWDHVLVCHTSLQPSELSLGSSAPWSRAKHLRLTHLSCGVARWANTTANDCMDFGTPRVSLRGWTNPLS